MSPVDIITSLRDLGLSSVAVWPVLMNWRSVVSYVPSLERFISQHEHWVDDAIQNFLASWYGFLFGATVCSAVLSYLLNSVWKSLRAIVLANWHTKCSIPTYCDSYNRVCDWVNGSPEFRDGRLFLASEKTRRQSLNDMGIDFPDGANSTDDIQKIRKQNSVSLEPTLDTISFWHKGAYFWLKIRNDQRLSSDGNIVPDIYLDIYCFTWNLSVKPMADFLKMIDEKNNDEFSEHTRILSPRKSPFRGRTWDWTFNRLRPKRPLHTVLINRHEMDTMVADIRAFLSSAGVRWYRRKGLPVRLGYLFSGPPGTGKSSLAFALAGHFGLPVLVLNLSLPKLTDKGVADLFSELPFHCVVLLEDIDATKPLTRAHSMEKPAADDDEDDDDKNKNTVTLSGLLNAIDGVGAAEGRILIMTTNHIEVLDEALIRTGRADIIVTFTNVTKQQAVDMFIHAYSGERWAPYQPGNPQVEDWTEEDIKRLAEEFAAKIREEEFSPALLQQYFKEFRVEPRRAVQEVEKWMDDPRGYRKRGLPEFGPAVGPAVGTGAKVETKNSEGNMSLWDYIDCST
ncbi:hypothetical protein N8I77_007518 [Diaporthe amygdali]|uniref:AAA+ ATPase domain-containing protein n=1 Tax=Phomopsis amygdali TaxID=1214568 RepID=A0AAD9SD74_PHOAM|nr:hypothetical protein N8I77_007518 [Diaporthe amygdali]